MRHFNIPLEIELNNAPNSAARFSQNEQQKVAIAGNESMLDL